MKGADDDKEWREECFKRISTIQKQLNELRALIKTKESVAPRPEIHYDRRRTNIIWPGMMREFEHDFIPTPREPDETP